MNFEWMWVAFVLAFLLAAFFAGAETAIIATNRVRVRHHASKGDRRARLLLKYINDPGYFLSIVLVGTNLGVIGCTSLLTGIMIHRFGPSGATVATVILVPSLLIFEEIIPKGIFLYYADRAALLAILPLRFFAAVLYPVIKSFSVLTNTMTRLCGVGKVDRKVTMTMEELLFHLQGSRDAGLISRDTMTLVSRAFELIDFSALDVMVAIDRVVMVEKDMDLEYYHAVFKKERFTRWPVYEGDRHHIVGFVSIHNLLMAEWPQEGGLVIEPPYIVDVDTPIVQMLIRMKNNGCHMAMVREKSGRIVGMTTLEDILERLVGAIVDEFH